MKRVLKNGFKWGGNGEIERKMMIVNKMDDMRKREGRINRKIIRENEKRGLRIGLWKDNSKEEGDNGEWSYYNKKVFNLDEK